MLERGVFQVASAFAFTGRMFVIGRGPEFATAREIALKLLETTRIANSPGASSRGGKKSHSSSSRSSSTQGGTTAQKKAAGRKGGKAAAKKR